MIGQHSQKGIFRTPMIEKRKGIEVVYRQVTRKTSGSKNFADKIEQQYMEWKKKNA